MSARDLIEVWDREAASFDEAADHGLRDPAVRAAWRDLLLDVLPAPPARVADLGCGTGTLSLLLAGEGYAVDGVDFSREMVLRARAKAAEHPAAADVGFVVAEASQPPLVPGSYDVVLSRHVLWALPDPADGLARWIDLLAPSGLLVLVEGRWSTGAGLTSGQTMALLARAGRAAEVVPLPQADYWGGEISDERYLVVSQ
jgi:SAM-dependent methyltransferase